ncbi:PREDICTED: protein lethal(2)essential for life-like [Vollenhovia emeryi]|uniref:protein lethal(2)essential for life-like n=1 Tax=Vollenhovia emeryi TaxID=411798 RepID=UPI0005F5825C|nr:PREDICTED: protein lethal(2)essential for life-like [Vollenhovia emeryi]
MSLVSRNLFRNWWDDIDRYHREIDEHFNRLSLRDDDLWLRDTYWPWRNRYWPWYGRYEMPGSWARVERDDDKYQVIVDVQQFSPEEIIVRTDHECITVEARHRERKDRHGYIQREFIRRYLVPKGYDIGHVKPSLSSDGILTITAPRLALPAPGERIVPIRRTYLPAIKAK